MSNIRSDDFEDVEENNRLIEHAVDLSDDLSIDQSMDRSFGRSVDLSVTQSMEISNEPLLYQPANRSIEQAKHRSIAQSFFVVCTFLLFVSILALFAASFDPSISQSIHQTISSQLPLSLFEFIKKDQTIDQAVNPTTNPTITQSADRSDVQRTVLYVKPSLSDQQSNNQDGSFDNPYLSLHLALDHAAQILNDQSINQPTPHVRVLQGIHHVDQSVKLDHRHSGSVDDPLIIEGWNDQSSSQSTFEDESDYPTLSGGIEIPNHCIKQSNELSIKQQQRLNKQSVNQIVAVNLMECLPPVDLSLLTRLTPFGFSEPLLPSHSILYQSTKRTINQSIKQSINQYHLARYPNDGQWLRIDQSINEGSILRNHDFDKRPFSFLMDKDTSARLVNQSINQTIDQLLIDNPIWMFGYWKYDWAEQAVQIKSIKQLISQPVNQSTSDNFPPIGQSNYESNQTNNQPNNQSIDQSSDQSDNQLIIKSSQSSHYGLNKGARYYLYNILAELDTAGEYYIDSDGWLYTILVDQSINQLNDQSINPSIDQTIVESRLFLSYLDRPIIDIRRSKNVIIRSINVAHTRSSGIRLIDCSNVLIDRLVVHSVGNAGVMCGLGASVNYTVAAGRPEDYHQSIDQSINQSIDQSDDEEIVMGDLGKCVYHRNLIQPMWHRQCGINLSINRTIIHHTGAGGIIMGGGDRMNLGQSINQSIDQSNNQSNNQSINQLINQPINSIRNTIIHHYSTIWSTYRPAALIDGVRVEFHGNTISHAPHSAIILIGNDHMITNNRISHVCQHTADVGVIYTGRDYTQRGHLIANNIIHHISGSVHQPINQSNKQSIKQSSNQRGKDANAIYFDDLASGSIVRNNLFYRVHRGVFIGGGREHVVENNLFISVQVPIHIDSRGIDSHKQLMDEGAEIKTRFYGSPIGDQSINQSNKQSISREIWTKRYPSLNATMTDRPGAPVDNLVSGNLMIGCGMMKLSEKIDPPMDFDDNPQIPTSVVVTPINQSINQSIDQSNFILSVIEGDSTWSFLVDHDLVNQSIVSTLYNTDPLYQLDDNDDAFHSHAVNQSNDQSNDQSNKKSCSYLSEAITLVFNHSSQSPEFEILQRAVSRLRLDQVGATCID